MITDIYIVSGFLGAGKTTLIQKMIQEAFQKDKVVLIENDFGEISVDAALLKEAGIAVKEINAGCICCSLSGDFVKSLEEILKSFQPDKIIIEPSGVGKLSDIVDACSDKRILPFAKVKTKFTVVDVKRCKMYLHNFGEFFEDQIQNADHILLSRTEKFPDRIGEACELVRSLNPHASILSSPWDKIHGDEILYLQHEPHISENLHIHTHECGCHSSHEHHKHCGCHHSNSAEDTFETVTIRTNHIFSKEDLKAKVLQMEQTSKGMILRAKGILSGPNGYMNLQYLPGDIQITDCDTMGHMICIIGNDLDQKELVALFNGE